MLEIRSHAEYVANVHALLNFRKAITKHGEIAGYRASINDIVESLEDWLVKHGLTKVSLPR